MQLYVLAVRDIKGGFYHAPHCSHSVGLAERDFSDEVNRSAADNRLYLHPADFELYKLGVFDSISAEIVLERVPVLVATGISLSRSSQGNGA